MYRAGRQPAREGKIREIDQVGLICMVEETKSEAQTDISSKFPHHVSAESRICARLKLPPAPRR